MAKTSSVEKNNRRRKLADQYGPKRAALKAIIMDQSKPMEERFRAQLKLAARPRSASATAAKSPAVRVPTIASSKYRASRFVISAITARSRAWSSRAGKEDITCH